MKSIQHSISTYLTQGNRRYNSQENAIARVIASDAREECLRRCCCFRCTGRNHGYAATRILYPRARILRAGNSQSGERDAYPRMKAYSLRRRVRAPKVASWKPPAGTIRISRKGFSARALISHPSIPPPPPRLFLLSSPLREQLLGDIRRCFHKEEGI